MQLQMPCWPHAHLQTGAWQLQMPLAGPAASLQQCASMRAHRSALSPCHQLIALVPLPLNQGCEHPLLPVSPYDWHSPGTMPALPLLLRLPLEPSPPSAPPLPAAQRPAPSTGIPAGVVVDLHTRSAPLMGTLCTLCSIPPAAIPMQLT
jgi:hypothetical protein